MELIGYLASIMMGLVLGLIGGGGSILTVPILVYLFAVDAVVATAYSLFIVGTTALAGGVSYLRKGDVDLKTGFIFAVPSFVGVYFSRAYAVPALPDPVLSLGSFVLTKSLFIMSIFAILMIAASVSMIKAGKSPSDKIQFTKSTRISLIAIEGLVIGMITGIVGAGGGFLIIPALVLLVGMPMKIAVGTSLFIIASKSLIGFMGDVQRQPTIDWKLLLSISAVALLGLLLGTRIAGRISEKTLKKGFGIFVLAMGTFILVDQLRRM